MTRSDVALDLPQVATQSAPATGRSKLYHKSDGYTYTIPNGGSESLIGYALPCTSATRPSSPPSGLQIYETDTKNSLVYDGVAGSWKYLNNRALCTSSTRPSGGLLQAGLEIFETDTGNTYVYYGGTWVQINASGGLELGYAQITTNSAANTSGTMADVTGLSITVTVGSRPIYVHAQGDVFHSNATAAYLIMYIREGSTTLSQWATYTGADINARTANPGIRLNPSAGSHTYKISILANSAASGITVFGSTTAPAYIRAVEC